MKALVKAHPRKGLSFEGTPEPSLGITRGTGVHIYNWDAWASSTLQVRLAIGYEFGGEVMKVGSHRNRRGCFAALIALPTSNVWRPEVDPTAVIAAQK
jgi:threonine dehydrogenase-like Zn-dependent dehydrogenase